MSLCASLYILLALSLICHVARASNETCIVGSGPVARKFEPSEIGKYCRHWSGINSCCDQKSVDTIFDERNKAYPSVKRCAIKPDFTDSCSQAFYATICFEACASNQAKNNYFSSGKLKICKAYAEALLKACKDYRYCDTSKACASSTEFVDGCAKYETHFKTAKDFIENAGYVYVDGVDSPSGTCFSLASAIHGSHTGVLAFVATTAMLLLAVF